MKEGADIISEGKFTQEGGGGLDYNLHLESLD